MKKLLYVLVLAASAVIISLLLFYPELKSYGLRLQQYVEVNRHKSTGMEKQLLEAANQALAKAPTPNLIPYTRDCNAGACIQKSPLTSQQLANIKRFVRVSNSSELLSALKGVQPGDGVALEPGVYSISQHSIPLTQGGSEALPIMVYAKKLGDVVLNLDSVEGFALSQSNWIFKNLKINGVCEHDYKCEHAFHLTGNANHLLLDNNIITNFNAAIKSNGSYSKDPALFPDSVKITNNDLYNTGVRNTRSPASPIDVVGGNNWLISHNYIADFTRVVTEAKSVVYGAFLKGGGMGGEISDNVINCAWNVPYQSILDVRIGLSLGDGGTAPKFCQNANCLYEHQNGRITNNLVLNCQNDVSIYLNKASDVVISNNVLLNSMGIDARFSATTATISGNVMHGSIKTRDNATVKASNNDLKDKINL